MWFLLLKNIIGYEDGDSKSKLSRIMLPQTSFYVKIMMMKLNGWVFWLKMVSYLKNIMMFGSKSALVFKKSLIENSQEPK